MKRMNCFLVICLFLTLYSFSSRAQCPSQCSTDLVGCASSCGSTCSGNFTVANFQYTITGTTVSSLSVSMCYVPGTTPPWTSTNVVGRLSSGLRPSATRTFTATASTGASFLCTVEPSGLYSVKLTSGTAPGLGTTLSGGSYSL